jgi:hypothetical protein
MEPVPHDVLELHRTIGMVAPRTMLRGPRSGSPERSPNQRRPQTVGAVDHRGQSLFPPAMRQHGSVAADAADVESPSSRTPEPGAMTMAEADEAFVKFEQKMAALQEAKKINERVEDMVADWRGACEKADASSLQLKQTRVRMEGLIDSHDALGGQRDGALRNLNQWFETVKASMEELDDSDGDEADGMMSSMQDAMREFERAREGGEIASRLHGAVNRFRERFEHMRYRVVLHRAAPRWCVTGVLRRGVTACRKEGRTTRTDDRDMGSALEVMQHTQAMLEERIKVRPGAACVCVLVCTFLRVCVWRTTRLLCCRLLRQNEAKAAKENIDGCVAGEGVVNCFCSVVI